jgi:GNAT superfamily N-acetyltransferase
LASGIKEHALQSLKGGLILAEALVNATKGSRLQSSAILVRTMTAGDLPAIHPLLKQLGYDMTPDEVGRRFAIVTGTADHTVLVADRENRVVGFLHAYVRPALEKPPEAVVQALVVDQACRKKGIGKILMSAAERWATQRGFSSVALTSNILREDAHAFYKALGYDTVATSHLLRKKTG